MDLRVYLVCLLLVRRVGLWSCKSLFESVLGIEFGVGRFMVFGSKSRCAYIRK